jgi:hypothetical protein
VNLNESLRASVPTDTIDESKQDTKWQRKQMTKGEIKQLDKRLPEVLGSREATGGQQKQASQM